MSSSQIRLVEFVSRGIHRKDGASSVMCCFAACLPMTHAVRGILFPYIKFVDLYGKCR